MKISGTETRSRILEVAWALVSERGTTGGVTVAEIAAAAGVSRQLVYFHFENRAGLLAAMARHHDVESGFVQRVAASRALPPVEALEALLRRGAATSLRSCPLRGPWRRLRSPARNAGPRGGTGWTISGRRSA